MKTRVANPSLADVMDRHTAVGDPALCVPEGKHVRCLACGHRCLIGDGLRGVCKVRYNEGGELRVPFGYVAALQCDPVEKKPFFHVYPSSDALTFGMLGCDYKCSYCQNWLTSQALRDANAGAPLRPTTPAQLVEMARREGARLVVSSYNEPLITAEWSVAVFREAKAAGLTCAFVSNGNATPEALDFVRPWLTAYKIDLKSFDDRRYRTLGGTLDAVTRSVRMVHERGLWLEVVTLVIPGFNDSDDELRRAADFLASVSRDIPWHVTAFHKDYHMADPEATPPETLLRACEIGVAAGLRFVYAGNLPGRVGPWEDTRCPSCRATVIARYGYLIRSYRLTPDGGCPDCGTRLPGVWPGSADEVRTGNDMAAYRGRLPRPVAALQPLSPGGRGAGVRGREQSPSPPTPLPPGERGEIEPLSPTPGGTRTMPSQELAAPPAELTAEEKRQVVAAAAALLRAAVGGQPTDAPPLPEHTVHGTFVSLKRGGHLRSCCGLLGTPTPLAHALAQAAYRTAWEDMRFPPVSPAELEHLDLEVWLLYNPQPVAARGEDRLTAVTVGRHGIQVVRGDARGLFLPGVAVEQGWDARRFLDHVCVKAGLPPTAWRDDATALFTFEGEALNGTAAGPEPVAPRPAPCHPEHLPAYADICRHNLAALLTGATPSYYHGGVPDGTVAGAVLTVQRPDTGATTHFSQTSLRPGLPLQATLFGLVQAAAQALAAERITVDGFNALRIGVSFLHDPALHGTVASPHLAGFDAAERGVLVLERNKSALVFDPTKTADELLTEAAAAARVRHPAAAPVFSLAAVAGATPLAVSTAPSPVRGPAERPASVAGTFYEADPAALGRTVDGLLAGERGDEEWSAALVPHAGLRFSGRVAADVLRRIKIPSHVIVIGPKHTPLGMEWAVAPHRTWALPGGAVSSDFVLARKLSQAIPGLELDAAAHQREHAIEVELPLIARLAPQTKVVGIALGHGDLEGCRRFAEGLADLLRERDEMPLLLISSDMNHFAPDDENRRLDALAMEALEQRDPEALFQTVTENSISMCGVLPAVIVLETLRLLGRLRRAERVGYATTADVTGDTSRVVGYAGMLFG
jgi:AmmeMemoRadiSam system radical SAM enzyme/AmmeMemoRadiSam system protein B/AmmeMemoRadiSam system protein A